MRTEINKNKQHDHRIRYRGKEASRFDNLTDAVFGIAITLLIFNLTNPNSFEDLLSFTKTLPAFLISISFIIMIWREHLQFSEIYTLNDIRLIILNTLFIALIIFYVYPLRFMTLFLTNYFFQTNIEVYILGSQVPHLMMYYGFAAFAVYFILYLFYRRANQLKHDLKLSNFEIFYTQAQQKRLFFMFVVPLISITLILIIKPISFVWASVIGGITYNIYIPLIIIWNHSFQKKAKTYDV